MDFLVSLLRGLLGVAAILGIAFLFSNNRSRVNWRMVCTGLLLQLVIAIFILKGTAMGTFFAPLGWPKAVFSQISSFFVLVLSFTTAGSQFVFGDLALPPTGEMPPGTPLATGESWGNLIAFQVLPTIIFFGALMAILYHLGIMQRVVQGMAYVMRRLLRTSGAESLSVTSNIFVGQSEAPLVIRPYLTDLTTSEMMAVMSGGMATIAGGVMAAYIVFLGIPYAALHDIAIEAARLHFAEHLLGASLMAAPAALIISKIIIPETATPVTGNVIPSGTEKTTKNIIDAAAAGTTDGLKLALNVGAMLISFLALLALLDYMLGWGGELFGADLSMGRLLGWLFAPLAWLMGVPQQDILQIGSLLGIKIVANEFVAYLQLADHITAGALSPKSITMATFALCGFANFASIAIQIGGIGPLAPSRRSLLAQLGLKAVLAGTLANLMTATIAGILMYEG